MPNTIYYWKLRELGVRANAAHFVAGVIYSLVTSGKLTARPTDADYVEFAQAARNMSYTPLSYLPRAERNR